MSSTPSQETLLKLFEYKDGTLIRKEDISNRARKGDKVGNPTGNGYFRVMIEGKNYKLHRIIWVMFNGDLPEDLQIDHIDGVKLNNKIENLRVATHQENVRNRVKHTIASSKYKGVNYDKMRNKWKAETRVNNVSKHLCRFDTEEEAYAAYCKATKIIHGEFFNSGVSHE